MADVEGPRAGRTRSAQPLGDGPTQVREYLERVSAFATREVACEHRHLPFAASHHDHGTVLRDPFRFVLTLNHRDRFVADPGQRLDGCDSQRRRAADR